MKNEETKPMLYDYFKKQEGSFCAQREKLKDAVEGFKGKHGETWEEMLEATKKAYRELSEERRMKALKEYEEFKANLFK